MHSEIKLEKPEMDNKIKYEKPELVKLGDGNREVSSGAPVGPQGDCISGFIAIG